MTFGNDVAIVPDFAVRATLMNARNVFVQTIVYGSR